MTSRHKRYLYGALWGVVLFRVIRACMLTVAQYFTWKRNDISQFLLPPHQPLGYFLQYSWSHFWFSVALSLGSAALFTGFLVVVRQYRPILFSRGDAELSFLAAVILGWPKVVIFIPLVFVILAALVFYVHIRSPGSRTPLLPALAMAGALGFVFGDALLDFFGLAALTV